MLQNIVAEIKGKACDQKT